MRQAQTKYNDRGSEEGQEAHRREEADRRERRAAVLEGDRRHHENSGELRARPPTTLHAVSENLGPALVDPAADERVGDHRCHENSGELRVRPTTAPHAVSETLDAALVDPVVVSAPAVEVVQVPPRRSDPPGAKAAAPAGGLTWVLVAWPELLAAANQRLGSEARCPFCRREGRIIEVISLERWRRRSRRGPGPEA